MSYDAQPIYRPIQKKSRILFLLFLIYLWQVDKLTLSFLKKGTQRMWISSFVVTLDSAVMPNHPVILALQAVTAFTLGEPYGCRLPVVAESPDGSTARYWHEWVEQLPGVVQVEVAFVSFDETAGVLADVA
jgi:nitrate reductase NapAB chaperone NapD